MTIPRRALLLGGVAAAGGIAATTAASPASAAATSPAVIRVPAPPVNPLWREFARSPFTHPQVPNVSFAGYRYGTAPPCRRVLINAARLGADPHGRTDSAPAINRAVALAGAAGGGAVLLPAGTYRVDDVLLVGWSGVVLHGAGSGRTVLLPTRSLTQAIGFYRDPYAATSNSWSWTGGLVWVSHRRRYEQLVASIRFDTPDKRDLDRRRRPGHRHRRRPPRFVRAGHRRSGLRRRPRRPAGQLRHHGRRAGQPAHRATPVVRRLPRLMIR